LQSAGTVTNQGLIEATNNGVLQINGGVINNAGANITANGSGASVQLLSGATIQGGNLNNNGGAFFGTVSGYSAYLDGSTGSGQININGTYTGDYGSTTYLLGTINNLGTIQINAGAGAVNNTTLETSSPSVTLTGGGIVNLTTLNGGFTAFLYQATGGETLTNLNNTIQGEGIIGYNGLTLVNTAGGTINANSTGIGISNTLSLQGLDLTNQGLAEATNSGVLQINGITVNNAGGNITANTGAQVQLLGNATIQGGTLNNIGGVFLGTVAGQQANLDGSTPSGQVTINGTYTADYGSNTLLYGTINNQGTIQVNAGAGEVNNTVVQIGSSNVKLTGGGTLNLTTLPGGFGAFINQSTGGEALENFNNTIQGNGTIGNNGLSLLNDVGGTVLANVSGGTLLVNGGGTVTNNGTFQANAGSALHLSNVNFTNFSGNTLTNGTYIINGTSGSAGTLQIDALGTAGGEIVNNAASIILNGPNSNFVDANGNDALSNLAANTTANSNLTITGGRNLTTSGDFSNAGTVLIGTGSTMQIGPSGTNSYTQTGGRTTVNGVLDPAGPVAFDLKGGVLGGFGSVDGNVLGEGGTIAPGAINATGELTINGNLTDTGSALAIRLGGTGAGQFDVLDVNGNVDLGAGSTLEVSLVDGFTPTNGETFTFLDFSPSSLTSLGFPGFFGTDIGLTTPNGTFGITEENNDNLTLTFTASQGPPPPPGTPEPAPMVMLASGAIVWALLRKRTRGQKINE
jgi:hypothetical protein